MKSYITWINWSKSIQIKKCLFEQTHYKPYKRNKILNGRKCERLLWSIIWPWFRAQVVHTLAFFLISYTLSGTPIMYMNWFCKGCHLVWWGDPLPPRPPPILDIRHESFWGKKRGVLLYSSLPSGTYHKNLVIWKKNLKNQKNQNLVNLGHFFHEKSFV